MKPILVFQTDFTYKEAAVSAMYGVVKTVDRELEIYDSTHEIPNYDIWSASYRLFQPFIFWPKGTVFVSVCDPGVGTDRKAVIAKTNNGYFVVTPDNGTLTHVKKAYGIEKVVEIDIAQHRLKGFGTEGISVFHGRDVFAYCAARLASGQVAFEDFGKSYAPEEIVTFTISDPFETDKTSEGIAEIVDPNFGNLWTNVPFNSLKRWEGKNVLVTVKDANKTIIFEQSIPLHLTFGEVAKGELTIYQNEYGNASIAINQGSLINQYPIIFGPDITVKFRGE